MDAGIDGAVQAELNKNEAAKKAPRKPRPSEIAAKKAKATKTKAKGAGKSKPKPKAKPAAKKKAKAAKRKPGKVKPKARPAVAVVRSERLDMRLTKAEKAKVHARAVKLRRTITSVVLEAIEKIK